MPTMYPTVNYEFPPRSEQFFSPEGHFKTAFPQNYSTFPYLWGFIIIK